MHLRLTFLDLTKQLGVLPDGTPDYMRIGEDVINSEVGAASFNLLKMGSAAGLHPTAYGAG